MLRIAIIGAGRIAQVHAAAVAAHQRARLVLCASPRLAAAADLVRTFGGTATDKVRDAYLRPDVDAVIVCSPTTRHVEQIIGSVGAGKAVLTEKPVDVDIARIDECLAATAGSEHRVMVGFNRRFDPSFAEVLDRVRSGDIGELEQLTITSRDTAPPPPEYLQHSGGIFRDMAIHDLDLAAAFLGDIAHVTATGQLWNPQTNDFSGAVTTLTAPGGAIATIINSRHSASGYDQRLEAFGTTGSLVVDNQHANSVRYNGSSVSGQAAPYLTLFQDRYARSYRAQLDHFITCLERNVPMAPTLHDGRNALVLANAATDSALSKLTATSGTRP